MSFSFRSMFQSNADSHQQSETALLNSSMHGENNVAHAVPAMMTTTSPPLNAASPFGAPLFKVAPGEASGTGAVQSSPFSASATGGSSVPLTVGDVLPQLPPDVARAGALPPDQPVAISSQILDEALRSGQAAIPIFEVYRVCPALFQTPISPQDPRMIPLPASKLPRLIAATQSVGGAPTAPGAPPMNASPFATAPSAGGMMMEPQPLPGTSTPSGMLLPPRRQGPPPPLAEIGSREASPQISLPGAPAFPVSPFAAAGAEMTPPPAGSPFATAPTGMAASPFGSAPGGGSPFGIKTETAPAPAAGSPFAAAAASPFSAPAPAASPFGAAPAAATSQPLGGGSPFGTLFGDKAVPTGQPAPDAPGVSAQRTFGQASMPPSSPAAGVSSGSVRISLASLLKGYSAAELGFDPMVVPAWITTSMPAAAVSEFIATPTPLVELGLLVDGITDVGFRNVLNTARREFQLRVDPEVLQNAMAGSGAPPTLPNLTSLTPPSQAPAMMTAMPPAGSPFGSQGGVMRVEPPAGFGSPPPAAPPSAPFGANPASVPAGSPFTPSAQVESPFASAPASPFQVPAALPPAVQAFSAPQPVETPAAPSSHPFPTFQSAPPARPQDPFAAAAPAQPSFQPAPAVQAASFQPAPAASLAFTPPPESFAPAPAAETTVLPPEPKPFIPPAFTPPAQESIETGFSSEQLLGQQPPTLDRAWSQAASAAATGPLTHELAAERARPSPVIDLPASPPSFFDAPAEEPPAPPPIRAFIPPVFEEEDLPPARPARPAPAPAATPRPVVAANSSLGVQTHDANPDQIVLRALLDTDSDLTAQRVVELTCGLPGIAACVCIHNGQAISHAGAHKPQAREFQKQASSLAQHLRTLAPLIGIADAETFTMNSGDRLMTFCFPDGAILGVLHDAEPTLGLRDKITLIARELSRMIS